MKHFSELPRSEKAAIAFAVTLVGLIALAHVYAFGKMFTGDWCSHEDPAYRQLGQRFGPYFGECLAPQHPDPSPLEGWRGIPGAPPRSG